MATTTTAIADTSISDPATRSITLRAAAPEDVPTKSQTTTPSQITEEEVDEENIYDEIEIEDMTYDASVGLYHYPCPCGDRFEIYVGDMRDGNDIGICPGCSLMIKVIFDQSDLPDKDDEQAKNEEHDEETGKTKAV